MSHESPSNGMLRVTLHEGDMRSLMERYPKLTRTEISDVITKHGPLRVAVEGELARISSNKR